MHWSISTLLYWHFYLCNWSEDFFHHRSTHLNISNKTAFPLRCYRMFSLQMFIYFLIGLSSNSLWFGIISLLVFTLFFSLSQLEDNKKSLHLVCCWAPRYTFLTLRFFHLQQIECNRRGRVWTCVVQHGRSEISAAPPAPAAAPDAPRQAVTAVGLPLQPVPGPGCHSQDDRLLQRWGANTVHFSNYKAEREVKWRRNVHGEVSCCSLERWFFPFTNTVSSWSWSCYHVSKHTDMMHIFLDSVWLSVSKDMINVN